MGGYILRPAGVHEAEQLAAIKSRYIRSLYRGFLAADYLREATPEFYLPEISWWLRDKNSHLDVLEVGGQAVGFVVYGVDLSDPNFGLIREEAIQPELGRREKDALAQHAIRRLEELGYPNIHLWVLRDNFRVRFLFESLGFRADGAVRVELQDEMALNISRYVYHAPTSGSGRSLAASIE